MPILFALTGRVSIYVNMARQLLLLTCGADCTGIGIVMLFMLTCHIDVWCWLYLS